MSHSYRDTQGGSHRPPPPQVVKCPNHPRLDRVKMWYTKELRSTSIGSKSSESYLGRVECVEDLVTIVYCSLV